MTNVPVAAGLRLDLAAATLARSDGQTVTSWPDTSPDGNAADNVIATAPIYREAITGTGGPAVRFTNGALRFTNQQIFEGIGAAEVFIVARTDGTADNPGLYQFGGSDFTYYPYSDGYVYDGSFTRDRYFFPAVSPGQWHVYNVSHDGTTRTTRIDGTIVHTASTPYAAPSTTDRPVLVIGRTLVDYPWHGDIAQVVAYGRALSDAERTTMLAYLTAQHITAPVSTGGGTTDPGTGGGGTTDPGTGGGTTDPGTGTGGSGGTGTGTPVVVAAGPADVGVDAPAPSTAGGGTLALLTPIGVVVPSARPSFTVTATADTTGQWVQVQYGPDPVFGAGAASVSVDAPAGLDDAQLTVQAAGDVADGVVWWRARLASALGAGAWTDPARFAVNALEGQAVAYGALTVDASAQPVPHLWYIDHDESGTDTGGQAVLIGTGFGTAPQVLLGTLDCPVVETLTVAAAGDPADRRVVPGTACDPWHQQITLSIPEVDPDHAGDALTVIGGA